MKEEVFNVFDGIKLHVIDISIFKTNFISVFLLNSLNRNDVTKNALIPAVLRRGTKNLLTMKDINIKLEEMYGSSFDTSIDKFGDVQAIEFYSMCINNNYTISKEDLLKESIDLLCSIILEPKLVDGCFDEEYVKQEKETIKEIIKGRINNKGAYAQSRMLEEMCKNEPFGIYKYGYIEDLEKITSMELYEQYKNLLATSEIHIFVSGEVIGREVLKLFKSKFEKIDRRYDPQNTLENKYLRNSDKVEEIIERQDVTQGKLALGYSVDIDIFSDDYYKILVYTAILGGTPGSKLFQNVREKASLAYTIGAKYIKHKGILMISAGIEINDFEKAKKLIEIQIDDMKNGKFSDEDILNAKVYLENAYRSYSDEQVDIINFYMNQELMGETISLDELIDNVNSVTREDIILVSNKVKLDTIYFLKNKEEA